MPPVPPASSASAVAVRATAITGAPACAKAVAMPRPRPRLAPTTIVVLSDSLFVGDHGRVSLLGSWLMWVSAAAASAGSGSRIVVLATASESSSRRTSAKIAGRAMSAMAPSTQNACWKPPVSAAGTAWPA